MRRLVMGSAALVSSVLVLLASVITPVNAQSATVLPIATIVADDSLATEPITSTSTIGADVSTSLSLALAGGHFRVSISRAASSSLTILYTIAGSATNGADYPTLSGSVVIPAGSTSAGIDIAPIHDGQAERDESIILTLTSGTGYGTLIGSTIARVTIVDSDRAIQMTVLDGEAAEPGINTGSVQFDRLGTLRGRLAVAFNLGGSVTDGVDIVKLPDSLVYADGQSSITLTVTPRSDNVAEGQEFVLFRTVGVPYLPTTGAIVHVTDATVKVSTALPTIVENQGNTTNFIITRTGDLSAAATISFSVGGTAANGVDYNTVPTTVTIPAGSAATNVPIVIRGDAAVEGAETIVLTVNGTSSLAVGSPNVATLVIDEASVNLGSLTLSSGSLVGGQTVTGTIQLNGQAPAGGAAVSLSLSAPATVATLSSASIVIPAGSQTGTFTVSTLPVANQTGVIVTASLASGSSLSRQFTLAAPRIATYALSRSAVTPLAVRDSTSVSVSLTIDSPAPAGGLAFNLASSDAALIAPATMTVAGGQTSASIPVSVLPVGAVRNTNLTVSRNGTNQQSVSLTINPPAAASVALSPTQVVGQTDGRVLTTATVNLNGPAPASGFAVSVSRTSAQGAIGTPLAMQVTGGATSGNVGITATPVAVATPITVTGAAPGGSASATLTVNPPPVDRLTITPDSLIGGAGATANVQLAAPAAQGFVIPVASDNANAFPCVGRTAIPSLTATAGATTVPFTVCTLAVTSVVSANITGGTVPPGGRLASTRLRILPPIAIILSDNDVTGAASTQLTGTIQLPSPAEGTQSISVTSSDPSVGILQSAGSTPVSTATFNIGTGQSTVGFQIVTKAVPANRTVTLTASPGSSTASVLVRAPVISVLNPLSGNVNSGTSRDMDVTLNVPAPAGGLPVQLQSSAAVVSVPSVVTVPKDSFKVKFAATIQTVTTDVDASVTATTGTTSRTATMHVVGSLRAQSLTVPSNQIAAGDSVIATLTLSGPAPSAGVNVPITTGINNHIVVPSSVNVPGGQTSTQFVIRVLLFGGQNVTSASLQAALGGANAAVTLSLLPVTINTTLPNSIISGTTVTGTLVAGRPAPAGGLQVSLSTSNTNLSVPASVTIAAGQTTASFTATAATVTAPSSVSVVTTFDQFATSRSVNVTPQSITAFTINPVSVVGGSTVTFSIQLSALPGSNGQVIQFSASVAGVANIPGTITIGGNSLSASGQFSTATVTTSTAVTITVSLPGGTSSKTAFLTVNP